MWKTSYLLVLALTMMVALTATGTRAQEYVSGEEVAAITGASAAAFGAGSYVKRTFDSTDAVFWAKPTGVEKKIQYLLGGEYYPDKTNFLDDNLGSAATPLAAVTLITYANLRYPQGDREKDVLQDGFLFGAGILTTKAVTDMTKGLFRRRRPVLALEPELAARRTERNYRYDHRSFVSGHTSSAFFSMVFLNARARSIMRSEMSADDYRSWRWLPPTVCFSWASFVGWTRIHAFKHYITDVAGGALVGWLVAELFLSLGDYDERTPLEGSTSAGHLIRLTFTI